MIHVSIIDNLEEKEILRLLTEIEINKIYILYKEYKRDAVDIFVELYQDSANVCEEDYHETPSDYLKETIDAMHFGDDLSKWQLTALKLIGIEEDTIVELKEELQKIIIDDYLLDDKEKEDLKIKVISDTVSTNITITDTIDLFFNCKVKHNIVIDVVDY